MVTKPRKQASAKARVANPQAKKKNQGQAQKHS
jgi:hypothetical protein